MPTFVYKAKKGPGEMIEGTIDAESNDAAATKLLQDGLIPVEVEKRVKEEKTIPRQKGFAPKAVSSRDLNIFVQQLAILISSGVEILQALEVVAGQTRSAYLKEVILGLQSCIMDGKILSEAIGQYPNVFSSIYVSLIRVGEVSGRLDESLKRLSVYIDRQEELKGKIRAALAYPILMVIVGIATIFILVSFVIPKLSVLLADFEQALPLPTQLLLKISYIFSRFWLSIVAGMIIFSFLLPRIIAYKRYFFDRVKLNLPVLGGLIKHQAVARFSATFSLLLKSGIPVFQALDIARATLENSVLAEELEAVRKDVVGGSSIAKSIKKALHLPEFLTHMIAVGEESGRLDEVLSNVAESYSRDVDITLKTIVSLLEPAIIIILGITTGFIVIAMLLPIFQLGIFAR